MRYREDSSEKGKQIYQVSPTSNILSFIKHNKRFQLIANMARWDSPRRCKSEFAQIENNKIKPFNCMDDDSHNKIKPFNCPP